MADCVLCYVDYGEEAQPCAFPCGHVFCFSCVCSLQSIGCPGCRWAPEYADPNTPNEELVTKLFIDFKGTQADKTVGQPDPKVRKILKDSALETAQRLTALIPGAVESEVNSIAEEAQKWINGMDAIQDVEIKVGLARVQYDLCGVLNRVKVNQEAIRRAARSEKDVQILENFNRCISQRLEDVRSEYTAYKKAAEERERSVLLEKEIQRDEVRESERHIHRIAKEIGILKDRVVQLTPLAKQAEVLQMTVSVAISERRAADVALQNSKAEMVKIRRNMMELRSLLEKRDMELRILTVALSDESKEVAQLRVKEKSLLEDIDYFKARAKMAEKRALECGRQLTAYMSRREVHKSESVEDDEISRQRMNDTVDQRLCHSQTISSSASTPAKHLRIRTRLGSSAFGGSISHYDEEEEDLDPLEENEDRPGIPITAPSQDLLESLLSPAGSERRFASENNQNSKKFRADLDENRVIVRSGATRYGRRISGTGKDTSLVPVGSIPLATRIKRARCNSPEGYGPTNSPTYESLSKKRRPSSRYCLDAD